MIWAGLALPAAQAPLAGDGSPMAEGARTRWLSLDDALAACTRGDTPASRPSSACAACATTSRSASHQRCSKSQFELESIIKLLQGPVCYFCSMKTR